MKYILSIDQGTTGSRAVVYDKTGTCVASAYHEIKQYFPKPGWVEHDPLEIWSSVINSVDEVLTKVSVTQIAAIGITNQRETTVVWDRATGKPVYNAIVWQCRRTATRCNQLKSKIKISRYITQTTGLPVDAYFSATKIEWILNNVPGARKKAAAGGLCFGTTDSWVLWNLTGGKTHATDYTNASRTMLYNINKLCWDKKLLNLFGVPEKMLPDVKPSSGIFNMTAKLGRLSAGVPISGIAGDQQSALFGQACFEPGTIKNTYGTGGFVLLNAGRTRPVSKNGLITTLCCGLTTEPLYALEGSVFIAGAAIQWLRDGLKIIGSAKETEQMSVSLTNNEGVYFVPALVGLGAPYWDQDARGSVFGITRGTGRNHFVRAAVEAICYQTKDVIDAMQKDTNLKIKQLKIDGGASANNFLCQFQSDMLGIPVVRPKTIETTSLGAAYLAGLEVKFWQSAAEIKKIWEPDRIFRPTMTKQLCDKYYKGWQDAISRTLTIRLSFPKR
jgi:glycerol kinase